jgi:hypothetical protein
MKDFSYRSRIIYVLMAFLSGLSTAGFGQLQWSSYNTSGALVAAEMASGGDTTYGGNVNFTVPAGTERIFMTETFVPLNLTNANAAQVINFSMTANGGLYPGSTGRILGMGLLNDPGTPSNSLDDQGYWTDFNAGNPDFELFYRPNTVTTFFEYDSAHKLGSSATKTGYPTNNITYGMQFQLNMNSSATGISIGTSSSVYANAGVAMTNGNGSVNELADSSAEALTTVPISNFNEFAFMFDNTTSSNITVSLSGITLVPANPVIAAQPFNTGGSPGGNYSFSVAVSPSSGMPLSYQWYQATASATNLLTDGATGNGSTLTGSTNATLTINNAQVADSAGFFVAITNAYGAVTSSVATLFVSSSPTVPVINFVSPANATVVAGNNTDILVNTYAAPTPVVYWYDNNSNLIQSGVSTVLTLTNLQPANAGTYLIVSSNSAGSASSNFTINIVVTPSISSQPTNLLLNVGDPASFSVTASGIPSPSYQWYKNGSPISGATGTNYSIGSVALTNIGTYSVVVSNSAGSVTSSGAVLAIYSPMSGIPTSPANDATGVCVDTLLQVTFNQTPSVGNTGQINIYNASNPSTPVDTLDLNGGNLQLRSVGGITLNSYDILINGDTATIYPHAGVLSTGNTYYVTIDPGVIIDTNGDYYAGITNSNTWQFTTKATGPANPTNIVVAANGSGDFCTVQGAIDSIPAANTTPTAINISDGLYTEIDRVNGKNNLTFIGQDRHQAVITYANNNNINGSSTTRPMFGVNEANNIAIENLTLTNSTPNGGSQAEALLVNYAKQFIVLDCDLDSYQDTLLVNQSGDQAYIQDSYIQGNTDYIWGSGTLYVTNTELMDLTSQSHLTQPRTLQYTNGFAFVNCRILGANSNANNCDLGRDAGASGNTANYPYGQVAYINCTMDTNVIIPAGWILGSGTTQGPETANLRFWEYESVDRNGNLVPTNSRVPWSLELDGTTATNQVQNATNWLYGWQPQLAPDILTNPASLSVAGDSNATFTVSAIGIPTPSYQWLDNGTNIPAATNATYTIPAAYAGNAGSYSVIVSNAAGTVTSSPVTLTVSNTAPTLAPVANTNINAGVTLIITNSVSDPDVPPQVLAFSLLSAPTNAILDASSGVFTWRPLVSQAGTTNPVTVEVTDNGTPNLSATQSFTVIVNPLAQPTVGLIALSAGQISFVVNGDIGPDYTILSTTNLGQPDWQPLFTTNSPVTPFTFVDTNLNIYPTRFYLIQLGP